MRAQPDVRSDRRLAGRVLSGSRLQDVAHEDTVDVVGGHTGTLQRRADRDGTELDGAQRSERAAEPAHGGPRCTDDDDVLSVHVRPPLRGRLLRGA